MLALASSLLVACGGSSGAPELIWYINPDPAPPKDATGPFGQAGIAARCTAESNGEYRIKIQELPGDATQQRVQLIRRLAAKDTGIDLMSLDPVFTGEFASAKFLASIPDDQAAELTAKTLDGAVAGATWDGKLAAAPLWANTQLLWYRKSFVKKAGLDMTKPVTWDQIITAAKQNDGTVGVQANKYEGYVVWINALVEGAGGSILKDPDKGAKADITIGSKAGQEAADVIRKLAHSPAAEKDLSVSNEGTVLGPFASDRGAFQVNWTFIFANYKDDKTVSGDLGWAMYPRTVASEASRPPLGGINIGINAASTHLREARDALKCLTSADNQTTYAIETGNMPSSSAAYADPRLAKAYPKDLLKLFSDSVAAAGPRPVTPYWSDISSAIQSMWHSPKSVNSRTPGRSADFIKDILEGKKLL